MFILVLGANGISDKEAEPLMNVDIPLACVSVWERERERKKERGE